MQSYFACRYYQGRFQRLSSDFIYRIAMTNQTLPRTDAKMWSQIQETNYREAKHYHIPMKNSKISDDLVYLFAASIDNTDNPIDSSSHNKRGPISAASPTDCVERLFLLTYQANGNPRTVFQRNKGWHILNCVIEFKESGFY